MEQAISNATYFVKNNAYLVSGLIFAAMVVYGVSQLLAIIPAA